MLRRRWAISLVTIGSDGRDAAERGAEGSGMAIEQRCWSENPVCCSSAALRLCRRIWPPHYSVLLLGVMTIAVRLVSSCCPREPRTFWPSTAQCATGKAGHYAREISEGPLNYASGQVLGFWRGTSWKPRTPEW
jgi:hypothetical protein